MVHSNTLNTIKPFRTETARTKIVGVINLWNVTFQARQIDRCLLVHGKSILFLSVWIWSYCGHFSSRLIGKVQPSLWQHFKWQNGFFFWKIHKNQKRPKNQRTLVVLFNAWLLNIGTVWLVRCVIEWFWKTTIDSAHQFCLPVKPPLTLTFFYSIRFDSMARHNVIYKSSTCKKSTEQLAFDENVLRTFFSLLFLVFIHLHFPFFCFHSIWFLSV